MDFKIPKSIEGVLPKVQAVVDPRHDEIGAPRKHANAAVQSDVHAVRRRSVEREDSFGDLAKAQWAPEAERVARGALLRLRREDDDVARRRERVAHRQEARARVAIIIREEDERRGGHARAQGSRAEG